MIYTRFGTRVTLLSPFDNEGFSKATVHYSEINAGGDIQREIQIFDLRADEGLNEIEAASNALVNKENEQS